MLSARKETGTNTTHLAMSCWPWLEKLESSQKFCECAMTGFNSCPTSTSLFWRNWSPVKLISPFGLCRMLPRHCAAKLLRNEEQNADNFTFQPVERWSRSWAQRFFFSPFFFFFFFCSFLCWFIIAQFLVSKYNVPENTIAFGVSPVYFACRLERRRQGTFVPRAQWRPVVSRSALREMSHRCVQCFTFLFNRFLLCQKQNSSLSQPAATQITPSSFHLTRIPTWRSCLHVPHSFSLSDLPQAVIKKIAMNAKKYPVKDVFGSSKKYTEYDVTDWKNAGRKTFQQKRVWIFVLEQLRLVLHDDVNTVGCQWSFLPVIFVFPIVLVSKSFGRMRGCLSSLPPKRRSPSCEN